MKTLLFVLLLFAGLTVNAQPQIKSTVRVDSVGNYYSITAPRVKGIDTPTGKYFMDSKGIKYPIVKTSTGRLVYYKLSRNGNIYKVYLDAIK